MVHTAILSETLLFLEEVMTEDEKIQKDSPTLAFKISDWLYLECAY